MEAKVCSKCKRELPLEAFNKNSAGRSLDGRRYECKECEKARRTIGRGYHKAGSQKYSWSYYRYNAKSRGFSWDLTFDEFCSFWQKPCSYCGRPIPTIGLDRIDSSIGYELGNVVSCCTICNRMKLNYSLEEWQTNMLMALKGMKLI